MNHYSSAYEKIKRRNNELVAGKLLPESMEAVSRATIHYLKRTEYNRQTKSVPSAAGPDFALHLSTATTGFTGGPGLHKLDTTTGTVTPFQSIAALDLGEKTR